MGSCLGLGVDPCPVSRALVLYGGGGWGGMGEAPSGLQNRPGSLIVG